MAAAEHSLQVSAQGTRAWNFAPGPAMLPHEVVRELQQELPDFCGYRQSVMEMPHRGELYKKLTVEIESELRSAMGIPDDYAVLFLPGGATLQYAMVPLNLAGGRRANYVTTGHWSERSGNEAKRLIDVQFAADTKASGYTTVPPISEWKPDPQGAYLHYTVNETINGVEFHSTPKVGMPLVADMTSMILSRPVNVREYGLIYASAQKNLGISGITLVIVCKDLLKELPPKMPAMLDYRQHMQEQSMYNTPPTFPWYVVGKMLAWTKRQGGAAGLAVRNKRKAELLYARVDKTGFYVNKVDKAWRSLMNVPFNCADKSLEPAFLKEADAAGLINLVGHRVAGGMRASIYNAMPEEGVRALVSFMDDFERRHG